MKEEKNNVLICRSIEEVLTLISKTLRTKLMVFSLLITAIPMTLIWFFTFQSQKDDLHTQVKQTLNIYANTLAVSIDDLIAERIAEVTLLSRNPIITNPESSKDEILEQMEHFIQMRDVYFVSILTDLNGNVDVHTDQVAYGMNLYDKPWFQQTLEHGAYISDIYMSPDYNSPVLPIAAMVYNDDQDPMGVIAPSFDLNYLWEKIDSFRVEQENIGLNGFAFLINGNGDVIIHPELDRILVDNYIEQNDLTTADIKQLAQSNALFTNEAEGTLNAIAPIEHQHGFDHDWYVVISTPEEEWLGPLDQLVERYILLFSMMLFMTMIAVYKLGESILNPVQDLVNVTTDFAAGKKVKPLNMTSYQEIDQLNTTFNQMVEKLEERELGHRKSTLILETTDNGVFAFHKSNGQITTFNATCEDIFQIKREDVLGKKVSEMAKNNERLRTFVEHCSLLSLDPTREVTTRHEFECHMDQAYRCFFASVSSLPKLDQPEEIDDILVVFSDLTEKKEMERELIRTEKLKAVGQLAAGFAHEIRNPLTTIKGFMQMLRNKQKQESLKYRKGNEQHTEQASFFPIIIEEIERVNEIVTDLLHLASTKDNETCKEIDVQKILEELMVLYQNTFEEHQIQLHKTFEPVSLVRGNPKKLKQVLINLIKNAIEAMAQGGQLLMTLKEEEDHVYIELSDTGVGMDTQTLAKLGTPFYTTKEKGTGLGMMTSYRIVEEMDGQIAVQSEVDKGTTFTIALPTIKDE
ncbi:ATP-binding protein [Caldalkalibacillus salinus]|uniref:ATP-binding protein n=1 Tax=Caldalkalibacillus salinus TaxID=2803787 RepID=UPI001923CAB2|nr:ATP-binding protein [Caldalkalibacillus salinus]